MKKLKLSSVFLFFSTFLFMYSIFLTSPLLFAQGEEEIPSCWECGNEDDLCSRVTSGYTSCFQDVQGACFTVGALCMDVE